MSCRLDAAIHETHGCEVAGRLDVRIP